MTVRPMVCIPNRPVIPSVGGVPNSTETYGWAGEPPMERSVHIAPVIDIDETGVVADDPTIPIHMQTAQASNAPVAVPDINVSYL
tara:strand:- start:26082 stop:26336 length:255 start_codon:yes stop_codon:yes gene_type:complete